MEVLQFALLRRRNSKRVILYCVDDWEWMRVMGSIFASLCSNPSGVSEQLGKEAFLFLTFCFPFIRISSPHNSFLLYGADKAASNCSVKCIRETEMLQKFLDLENLLTVGRMRFYACEDYLLQCQELPAARVPSMLRWHHFMTRLE